MHYVATRDSLESAAGIIGALPEDGGRSYDVVRPILHSLGRFLDKRGYTPPPTFCRADDFIRSRVTEDRAEKKEKPEPDLDTYIRFRLDGMSRSEAARQFNVSYPTFRRRLKVWGIFEPADETAMIAKAYNAQSNIESGPPIKPVEPSNVQCGYKRSLPLNITITEAVIRESINALVEVAPEFSVGAVSRDGLLSEIWNLFGVAKHHDIDIGAELLQRLREASV